MSPFMESAVIEQLEFIGNDKRNNAVGQAFLKHNQAAHTPVAVLKRMNLLEAHMEIEDVFQYLFFAMVIIADKFFHLAMYFLGRAGFYTANFVDFVFVCHDSAIRASTMAFAAPSVRKNPNKFGFSLAYS